jgi:hypothetical protein
LKIKPRFVREAGKRIKDYKPRFVGEAGKRFEDYKPCLVSDAGNVDIKRILKAGKRFEDYKPCLVSDTGNVDVKPILIKIIGRKPTYLKDVSEGETIGTLTEKIADDLGVDKRNWGFYVAGSKMQREFLPNSAKVREIKLNHDKNLHFLPRTVIR